MKVKPSIKQKIVIDTYRLTTDNIVIRAVAGSGKTTTLKLLFPLVRGKAMYLAFNNSVVDELKGKINQPNIEISTVHSVGCKSIFRRWGKVKVRKGKTYRFIKKASKKWEIPSKRMDGHFFVIDRLVDLYRLTLCKSKEDLEAVANKLGVECNSQQLDHALEVMNLLTDYNKAPKEIDFTDMVYLPAVDTSYELPKLNVLFIDECQDLNKAQHLFIDRLRGGNRFVAVGDPHQAIYGFAGADSQSFELFVNKPKTVELPLSVCYRCPSRVIDHANQIYDVLEPAPNAVSGIVAKGFVEDAQDKDMVICRNLKPLITAYFGLIAEHKKCYIKGKDIGESLIRLLRPYKGLEIDEMLQGLQMELHDMVNDLFQRGFDKPMKHPSYQSLLEKIGAIRVVSINYDDVDEMIIRLDEIFSDDSKDGVVLSTIHKSKGLEANNIFILNKHLIPSKFATTEDQLIQEQNLLYVATTRAEESLTYCVI